MSSRSASGACRRAGAGRSTSATAPCPRLVAEPSCAWGWDPSSSGTDSPPRLFGLEWRSARPTWTTPTSSGATRTRSATLVCPGGGHPPGGALAQPRPWPLGPS
eukprot:7895304-Pyramimonas_sp.AAC.1